MKTSAFALLCAAVLVAGCDDATMATIPGTDQFKQAEQRRLTRAQEVAMWESAVASVKCRLVSEGQYLPVELQTGLTRERVTEILSTKLARGEAVELPEGGYQYIAGPCAPLPEGVPQDDTQTG